jgi:uncharacterized protein (DUF433 family)
MTANPEDMYAMDYCSIIALQPIPCIRNLRITADEILRRLASGASEPEILSEFPNLTANDLKACAAFDADRKRRLELQSKFGMGAGDETDLPSIDISLLQPRHMLSTRETCPRCRAPLCSLNPHYDDPASEFNSYSHPYFCYSCDAHVNSEGFVELHESEYEEGSYGGLKWEKVREIGKGGRTIWEYTLYDEVTGPTPDSEKALRLLLEVSKLEKEYSALA